MRYKMNKYIKYFVMFGMMAVSSLVFAETVTTHVVEEDAVDEVEELELVEKDLKTFSFSFRAGAHDWKDSEFVKSSYAGQLEFKMNIANSPIDILLRGYYSNTEYDDYYVYYGSGSRSLIYDEKQFSIGGSAQLVLNFARGEIINPYITAGVMYEKSKIEYDEYYYGGWYWYSGWYTNELEDDGTTFVGRVGLEFNTSPIYGKLEGSFIGKVYDSDEKNQAEIHGVIGIRASDIAGIEMAANYLTEWEEFFITIGCTLNF